MRSPLGETAVLIENPHQYLVRCREIVELALQLVLPFHAVEQVVAVAEDNDEDRDETVCRFIILTGDDRSDQRFAIGSPEVQMVEMIGKLAGPEIAIAKIRKRVVEGGRLDAPPVGIEVTGALARASIEVGKSMAGGGAVPGFIGLQDDASSAAFAQARTRRRATSSRAGVERTIDTAIASRLARKDHAKYAGHILLVTAPTGSSPDRDPQALKQALGEKVKQLPFAEVYVLDTPRRKSPIQLK